MGQFNSPWLYLLCAILTIIPVVITGKYHRHFSFVGIEYSASDESCEKNKNDDDFIDGIEIKSTAQPSSDDDSIQRLEKAQKLVAKVNAVFNRKWVAVAFPEMALKSDIERRRLAGNILQFLKSPAHSIIEAFRRQHRHDERCHLLAKIRHRKSEGKARCRSS